MPTYLKWSSHNDDQIGLQHVLQVKVKPLGQLLTKEHDVWLDNALQQGKTKGS